MTFTKNTTYVLSALHRTSIFIIRIICSAFIVVISLFGRSNTSGDTAYAIVFPRNATRICTSKNIRLLRPACNTACITRRKFFIIQTYRRNITTICTIFNFYIFRVTDNTTDKRFRLNIPRIRTIQKTIRVIIADNPARIGFQCLNVSFIM